MRILKMLAAVALALFTVTTAQAEGVLVFGATGQLGAPHVRMLVEKGETVTAFVRPTSDRGRLEGLDINYAVGDLMDANSVMAAMEQAKPRVVIDTSAGRDASASVQDFHTRATQNIIDASKATGVSQIIIHSSIGVRGSAGKLLRETYNYDTDSPTMRDKGQAEVVLENSGIDYTILRNGLLEFEPAAATGKGSLFEDMDSFGRITRTDLAVLALDCMDSSDCMGKIYHAIDTTLTGPRPGGEEGG